MFNLEDFTQLNTPRDLSKIFDTTEYAKWKAFRLSDNARYVALVAPRVLMRLPYGRDSTRAGDFNFEEGVNGTYHSDYLWANPAFALASRLTNAFAHFGWCAAIRGVEGGGIVDGLPVHTFMTDEGDLALKCPAEIAITDRREQELAALGFIPLVHCKGTDFACFFSAQTCAKAKTYNNDAANAQARASVQLPYVLAISRFIHYLKAMMRDKIGSFMTRSQCEQFLNRWISTYVTGDDNTTMATKARYPLKSGHIEVVETPNRTGTYQAVAFLLPNFQLEQLSVPLRVVMSLPQSVY
jgi:type VI secretion system protein ImpC